VKTAIAPLALGALLAAGLVGCADDEQVAAAPPPAALDRDAIGYYCSMIVADHVGPKGQVHLSGKDEPFWFSSVRDTVAFTMLPGEPRNIAAIYVNDMGRASWEQPEPDTWIDAREAWYVVGSGRTGGMGAPETVPFAERDAADGFARAHGGSVARFAEIPEDAVLGTVDPPVAAHGASTMGQAGARGGLHAGAHVDTRAAMQGDTREGPGADRHARGASEGAGLDEVSHAAHEGSGADVASRAGHGAAAHAAHHDGGAVQ